MDKRKINFLGEVLSEISANFEGVENFIKEKIEEICSRKKDSSRGSNFFFLLHLFANENLCFSCYSMLFACL